MIYMNWFGKKETVTTVADLDRLQLEREAMAESASQKYKQAMHAKKALEAQRSRMSELERLASVARYHGSGHYQTQNRQETEQRKSMRRIGLTELFVSWLIDRDSIVQGEIITEETSLHGGNQQVPVNSRGLKTKDVRSDLRKKLPTK